MKKNFLLITFLFALCVNFINAQSNFKLTPTTYVGAMGADASTDWTQGWSNFNPNNTAYPVANDTTTLNGMLSSLPVPGELNITGTLTLDASKTYLMKGFVVVRSGGKLIIPAGTVIRSSANVNSNPKNYASILVERGGQIECNGTAAKPVVFTSAKAAGSRQRGDWGGLVLSGKAQHNLLNGSDNNNVQMEGFNNVTFDTGLARFGGTDPNDNSGSVTYTRIEFGGLAFETNKEINGLTLGAVGRATTLHHIQVSHSNDDSFEWFGGSVNSSHLIAWKGTDDDFDTDNGYSGISQFGIGVRDSSFFDLTYALPSGSSTSEGFESDNEPTGTASVRPYTNCIFSNFTMVGPVPVGSTYSALPSVAKSAFRRGARIRRNSSQRIVNSIFMGYRNFLMIDGDSCVRNTNHPGALSLVKPSTAVDIKTKQISFANNLIMNTAAAYTSATDTTANGLVEVARAKGSGPKLNALDSWLRSTGILANNINPVAYTAGTLLVDPSGYSATPNFRAVSNSPALKGAIFSENPTITNLLVSANEISEAAKFPAVFPNPVIMGTLNFGREVISFGIFDASGRLLNSGFNTDRADVQNLNNGIYFIKMDGQVQKFIVK
ncbi:MAG: T9SS type A sorting domain-containing protein [Saprospiraceae bacterium]